jgi:cytochrome c peroxidase
MNPSTRRTVWTALLITAALGVLDLSYAQRQQPGPGIHAPNALLAQTPYTSSAPVRPVGKPVEIKVPQGLPPVPIPPDNPPTAETIALGRRLYYDPQLSSDGTVSCATCHDPRMGFADHDPVSTGVQGKKGTRNSNTVINSAYNKLQFWDGRAPSLEKQAEGPVQNPVEMGHTLSGVEKRLMADARYRAEFKNAWGTDQITYEMVEKSIASFERTVLSGDSPFDRFYYGHDKRALSPAAQRGLKLFLDPKKGNCNACHTIGERYALFTDGKFHNIGVGAKSDGTFADLGRYEQTHVDTDKGAFKTPTLRNITQTAPYLHDGSLKTLKDVIDHYVGGGTSNPYLDKEIHPLGEVLTFEDRKDLLAILQSLTGKLPPNIGPPADMQKGASKSAKSK